MQKPIFLLLFLLLGFYNQAQTTTPIPAHNSTADKIDTTEIITIGGIKQYISIKGTDRTKHLLLFLHGGPGGSVMNTAEKFTNKLQEAFVVVQWDQRQTGKTLALNASPVPLTVRLFQDDTHELIDSLLAQFNQEKLYLVAHSWGTVLGFYIAGNYPQLISAYVAISPVINQLESEQIALSMLKQQAIETNNKRELKELSSVHIPFENSDQLYYARKWLFNYNGETFADKSFVASWCSTWLSVWNESIKQNLLKDLPAINCNVYLFAGRKDYQTNAAITEAYYNELIAPAKHLVWFEHSGHTIPDSEPGLLQDVIINNVLAGN